MSRRVCGQAGCPVLVDQGAWHGKCEEHRRQENRERGRERRGYGPAHRKQRAQLVAQLERGDIVTCWRCGARILTATDMHLGHDDQDRSVTRGPEHAFCNLSAAGRSHSSSKD